MKKILKAPSFILLFMMLYCLQGQAQNSDDAGEVTSVYFLKNAHVVQKPGMILKNTSILIRDGMIEAIGSTITPPFDAMVIDADSMFIYAGFIDMASHTAIPKKEEPSRGSGRNNNDGPRDPGNPTNEEAGITPEKLVIEQIKMSDKSVAEMRKNGFTISHIVPDGRMLPGRGAVVSLGDGSADHLIINPESSLFAQWSSSRGVAPATIIGMIAKWRDLYHNAENYQMYSKKYEMNPQGKPRPATDAATKSLVPIVEGKLPVFFEANKIMDIHKVLSLQEELGFAVVLTEVEQAYPIIDILKNKNVPVLLSMDLPKEIKEEKKKDGKVDKDKKEKAEMDDAKPSEDNPETIALKERKKKAYTDYLEQAGNLEKNEISFGFSFLNGKVKDFKTNIGRMIKSGLSEDGALAAITTTPAKMLGIESNYGTVEKGKMAHLVVTDKSYFEEKSNIKYVFVDGIKHEYEIKEPKKASSSKEPSSVNLNGVWSYEIEIPGMTRNGQFKIVKDGDDYQISMSNSESPEDYLECTSESLSGNALTFDASVENGGMTFDLAFDLTIDDDTLEGSVDVGQFGNFPVTGSKISTPE
jgi:hypothetical protein